MNGPILVACPGPSVVYIPGIPICAVSTAIRIFPEPKYWVRCDHIRKQHGPEGLEADKNPKVDVWHIDRAPFGRDKIRGSINYALNLMAHLHHTPVYLAGCDMNTGYYYGDVDEEKAESMRKFHNKMMAVLRDMWETIPGLISITPNSPINAYVPFSQEMYDKGVKPCARSSVASGPGLVTKSSPTP
jgi:hypothetical protein